MSDKVKFDIKEYHIIIKDFDILKMIQEEIGKKFDIEKITNSKIKVLEKDLPYIQKYTRRLKDNISEMAIKVKINSNKNK